MRKRRRKRARGKNHVRYMGKSKMKRWRIEIMAHPLHSFSFKLLLHGRDLHTTRHAAAHIHGRKGGPGEKEGEKKGTKGEKE